MLSVIEASDIVRLVGIYVECKFEPTSCLVFNMLGVIMVISLLNAVTHIVDNSHHFCTHVRSTVSRLIAR